LQKMFLSKTNSIFTGTHALVAAASNTDCFLSRDAGVSSTQLNRPIWSTQSLSLP
jgi:hypothetical protein